MISWTILGTSVLFFFFMNSASTRTLTTTLNEGCGDLCNNASLGFINVVHTASQGPEDIVHHIWSTGVGAPSLLLVHTSLNSNLTIDWEKLVNGTPGAVSFTNGPPINAFGIIFNKIWQYGDPEDVGSMSDKMTNVTSFDLAELHWQNISDSETFGDHQHSEAVFRTQLNTTDFFLRENNGTLSLQLETQGGDGRSDAIPRLLFTSNSSQARFVLDNLQSDLDVSRFAVEITVLTTASVVKDGQLFHMETVKSMDDEYTPGVFKSIHLKSNENDLSNSSSFMSWKPVAYTSDDLSVTGSTNAVHYDPVVSQLADQADGVVKNFFQGLDFHESVTNFNVSFGTSGDDYFLNTNYTQWSFYYGLGTPGNDEISSLVVTVLATGLGLPLLLIILSSVYLGWYKFRKPKDDLFLSRR